MGGYIDGKPWLLGSKGYSVGSRMMLRNRHRDICLEKKKSRIVQTYSYNTEQEFPSSAVLIPNIALITSV